MKTAEILTPTPENLARAAQSLRAGEVVGMPTETVYGLAGDALNEHALTRIFSTKERPTFDPLIVHVSPGLLGAHPGNAEWLEALERLRLIDLSKLDPRSRALGNALLQAFWPGPFTLVLPKHARVPDLVSSGMQTVGLRMPRHPVAQALIEAAGTPLAAPSANRFGRISPTSARDVDAELGDRIGLIVDGGSAEIGLESTVVFLGTQGEPALLRPGGVSIHEIEAVLRKTGQISRLEIPQKPHLAKLAADTSGLNSPGMLESHYAPRKPLYLLPETLWGDPEEIPAQAAQSEPDATLGLLVFSGKAEEAALKFSRRTSRQVIALSLSESGDLGEAARNLFASMRALDHSQATILFAETCRNDQGLGHAIRDRMMRAATRA